MALDETFSSLKVRNFRLFIIGQAVSLSGTWIQLIAIAWLVLKLGHSGTILGFAAASQFVPMLIFGAWGGVIADRFNKRYVLFITQSAFGLLSALLGILVITNVIQLWMIFVISIVIGLVQVVDSPTRQAFVMEMAGRDNLRNAVTLNSTMVNVARVIGPSIGGILIATVGVGECFLINAASFIAILIALYLMRVHELWPSIPSTEKSGKLMVGIRYVLSEPKLKVTILMMFIIGTFAYEFPVILPLFAKFVLHGNATTYSTMMIAMGIGAVMGGIYTAGHAPKSEYPIIWIALAFGISIITASFMPTYLSVLALLVVVGALSILFIALGNSTLQLTSEPSMRGRVMALWSVAFFGTTPIGGPLIGVISDHTNARIGFAVGGLSAIIAAIVAWYIYKRSAERQLSV